LSKTAAIMTFIELIGSSITVAETKIEVYLDYQNRELVVLTFQSLIGSVIDSY